MTYITTLWKSNKWFGTITSITNSNLHSFQLRRSIKFPLPINIQFLILSHDDPYYLVRTSKSRVEQIIRRNGGSVYSSKRSCSNPSIPQHLILFQYNHNLLFQTFRYIRSCQHYRQCSPSKLQARAPILLNKCLL